MDQVLPQYQVFAIRYATRQARRSDHFIGGDPHDGPMPMDYFTWVITDSRRVFLVDTGFPQDVGERRGRQFLRCPIETLKLLDIDPARVEDVVLTHMHWDHAGNLDKLPKARFHMQESESFFVTGRYMRYPAITRSFELDHVLAMVRLNFQQRLHLYDGDFELAPGLSLHHAPGHTPGLQVVRVHTRRGWVVLASDSSHYYEHIRTRRAFVTVFNVPLALEAYSTLERLAASPDHIVPGHDPLVMTYYPPGSAALRDVAVRLDADPSL